MIASEPLPGVLHLLYPTRLDLTLALHRIAEFYESPYPNIRGKAFTETEFLRAYAKPDGTIDYFSYWDGFNVPATAVEAFFDLNKNGIDCKRCSREEHEVMQAWNHRWMIGQYFDYLIATEVGSDPSTLLHELAHARWAIDPPYRAAMQQRIDDISGPIWEGLVRDLCRDSRYSDDPDLVEDEIQAYLSTGTGEELDETFPCLSPAERVLLQAAFTSGS